MYIISFCNLGIKVAEFQMNGLYSDETYLNHSGIGSKNLSELTYCLRYNLNFLRAPEMCLFSYSTHIDDNTISAWIEEEDDLLAPLRIRFCKYDSSDVCYLFQEIEVKAHQVWHHLCIIMTSHVSDLSNSMVWNMTLYFDGKTTTTCK